MNTYLNNNDLLEIMVIERYLNELRARRLSWKTIESYKFTLMLLDKFKRIDTVEKKDLIQFFSQVKGTESSILLYQVQLKKFFADIGKTEIASWIKIIKPKETLKSDDIITPDDINKMIDSTDNHYWKAMIAFLFETGCRISEALKLSYKDFKDTDQGMIVNIPTSKTSAGYRKVILPFSSQYLRNLKTYTASLKEDRVFKMSYAQTWRVLNQIAKDAGINKPISPHKLRHAQATDMVKRSYNEAIIRKKLGWTPTSPMIARYQHLNDEDVINATLENTGKLPQMSSTRIEIKEAERLTLVDAAMQYSKITEENSELRKQMEKQAADMETMKRQMELITAAMAAKQ